MAAKGVTNNGSGQEGGLGGGTVSREVRNLNLPVDRQYVAAPATGIDREALERIGQRIQQDMTNSRAPRRSNSMPVLEVKQPIGSFQNQPPLIPTVNDKEEDLPPLPTSNGSVASKSQSSASSRRSRQRALEKEEQLAVVREQQRQSELRLEEDRINTALKIEEERAKAALKIKEDKTKAEAQRLEEQAKLIEQRFQVEEDNDEEGDRRSNVLSISAVSKQDVAEWVDKSRKVRPADIPEDNIQQQHQVRLPRPNNLENAPRPGIHASPYYNPAADNAWKPRIPSESEGFQRMADSTANAMDRVIQNTRPNEDLKNFIARQTGARDLPEFHGDPEEWPTFHGRFQTSTELCGFSSEENIIRLQRCLKGKAKDSVVSMLSSACNVDDVIDVLKKRFGRPDQIIQKMLNRAKNAPIPTEGDFQSIIDFSLVLKNFCATAESLNLPLYLNNPQLMEEFRRKLPSHLQLEWGRHLVKFGMSPDLKELSFFLDEVASAAVFVCDESSEQPRRQKIKDQCMIVSDRGCLLGFKEGHGLHMCPIFKKMSVKDRLDRAWKLRVCFLCLKKGHSREKCPKPYPCKKDGCKWEHHWLLHEDRRLKTSANVQDGSQDGMIPHGQQNFSGVVSQVPVPVSNVLMKIVPVQLVGPKGRVIVNAFLDDGSSLTMIEEEVANHLGLDGERRPLCLNWLGGRKEDEEDSRQVSLVIRGLEENSEYELTNVRTKKNLNLPVRPMADFKNLKKWTHLDSIRFPEVLQARPAMVIGSDHSFLLLARKVAEGPRNAPMASWTFLGWVVHGPNGKLQSSANVSLINIEGMDPDQALHDLVKEQFRLDTLGVVNCKKLPQSKQNERAEMLMEKNSRQVGDRWETGMLWKTEDLRLPDSKHAAIRRLKVLEKKMDDDPEFAKMYCAKIQEYLDKNFCRKLTSYEAAANNEREWYLPHFGRTNPNKPGKLRLVFDCAARVNGTSLNDALLQGPDLMSPLINVLMKFRQREVAFSGDIRDMFHMVNIRQEDVPALRFLWRGMNRSQPPDVYTMDVMVFGAVSSPFQAQWIKNTNAAQFQDEFPDAVDAIQNRHYVDDYLDSCETVEQAIKKITEVREIHRRGGFEIRGWLSNEEQVLRAVDPENTESVETLNVNEDKLERVLGLHWDPKMDIFKFKTSFRAINPKIVSGEQVPTKRELLKLIMSMFDPLGFIAHLTVRGRILLQDVWRSTIGWDEKLKPEQEAKWKDLLSQIMKIPESVIRRCFSPNVSKYENLQLHVFCDASQQAFSSVAYLRATGRGDVKANVNLVMAKSRVSPLKCISIPRLEMEAALMGARMGNFIKSNLDLRINETYLWTDSRNVLCWIRAEDPARFKVYIAHRIGEIHDLTEAGNWKWVPTAENVADDATRDATPADTSPASRWFNGPEFLKDPESSWPTEKKAEVADVNLEDLEIKRDCCLVISEETALPDVTAYSSWMKLIRVTAWIRRFLNNFVARYGRGEVSTSNTLTSNEISCTVRIWVMHCQKWSFAEELEDLKKEKSVSKSSRISSLSPKLVNGIICVNSRVINSPDLPVEARSPAILDPKHPWTKLLIAWYHRSCGHHGVQMICNEIRQRYWITGLTAAVKKAARECLECGIAGAKKIVPEMAALPEMRVLKPLRPFSYVGVDYFGPLDVVNGRKRKKRYGVLFTCLSTRAVHLEVAFSLSTDDFLLVLCKFICLRGEPLEIWSDNGTNFKGAERELAAALKEMNQSKIEDMVACKGIRWNFIPPGAPHMGGAWERLVRSVKTAMYVILKNRTLNDQLLATVLAEAAASVNSRPLTAVSVDQDDPEAITPNCFLVGSTSIKQPLGVFEEDDLSTRKRWRHSQVLANHFWSRWVKEYLPSLALRSKWNKNTPDVVVGELVFVADLNQQRNQWTKGVVVQVFPNKQDGRVRVVDIKTATGIIRRPVAKLYRIQNWSCDSSK